MDTNKAAIKSIWRYCKALLLALCSIGIIAKAHADLPILTQKDLNSCKLAAGYSLPSGVELDKYCSPYQGLLEVRKEDKYGFANEKGEIVVPIIYDRVFSFYDNKLIKVELAGKQGFVSQSGQLAIPLVYDSVDGFSDGLAKVSQGGKIGFIDEHNDLVIPFEYDSGWRFNKGFADVEKHKRTGVIDKQNKVIVPFEYDDILISSDWQDDTPYFVLEKEGKYGVANHQGDIIVPLNFRKIGIFSDKLVNVKNFDEKWGFYDADGNIAIPFVYDYAGPLVDGLAEVQIDDKYGFINKKGRIVIPIQYDSILGNYFTKDAIGVVMNSKAFLINKQGKKISDDYDEISEFHGELVAVSNYTGDRINDYEGSVWSALINEEGEIISPMSQGILYPAKQGQYLKFNGNEPVQLINTSGEAVGVIADFKWPSH